MAISLTISDNELHGRTRDYASGDRVTAELLIRRLTNGPLYLIILHNSSDVKP